MAYNKKTQLHLAPRQPEKSAAEIAAMNRKIWLHRLKLLRNAILIVCGLALLVWGIYYFITHREYKDYTVLQENGRADSASTQFREFHGNILRYSNDGAYYMDLSNHTIWDQTYEFQHPIVDTCGTYATIAEQDGTEFYIMDTAEMKCKITTTYPIKQVRVAQQGSAAVLMEQEGVNYLQIYDKKGKNLAEGALHMENSGSALNIALSDDGKKLGVSMLDVTEGVVKTTIAFYNFDSVGQNEIDNIVASYSYKNTVVPRVEFVTNDRMAAFGDDKVIIFEGTQKPQEVEKIGIKKEVRSILYNDKYFGLIFNDGDTKHPDRNQLKLYDYHGGSVGKQTFSMDYTNAEFLPNGEICIHNYTDCLIYTMSGVKKFSNSFKEGLYMILPQKGGLTYTVVLDKKTEKIRLK